MMTQVFFIFQNDNFSKFQTFLHYVLPQKGNLVTKKTRPYLLIKVVDIFIS